MTIPITEADLKNIPADATIVVRPNSYQVRRPWYLRLFGFSAYKLVVNESYRTNLGVYVLTNTHYLIWLKGLHNEKA